MEIEQNDAERVVGDLMKRKDVATDKPRPYRFDNEVKIILA